MSTTNTTEIRRHVMTVTPAEPETAYHDGAYRIDCAICGHVNTYRGEQFTLVEAGRHHDYFASKGWK